MGKSHEILLMMVMTAVATAATTSAFSNSKKQFKLERSAWSQWIRNYFIQLMVLMSTSGPFGARSSTPQVDGLILADKDVFLTN